MGIVQSACRRIGLPFFPVLNLEGINTSFVNADETVNAVGRLVAFVVPLFIERTGDEAERENDNE
jgi:hypothetical protein